MSRIINVDPGQPAAKIDTEVNDKIENGEINH